MTTNATILDFASRQLQDITCVTWPEESMIPYLHYAVREIIDAKPEAGSVFGLIPMVAGTRQTVPEGWNLLINVKRNMGSDGTTPGVAISQIPLQVINEAIPEWHSWPARSTVQNMVFDDRDPLSFDVFPPQPNGTQQKVEAVGSAYPAPVTAVGDTFPLKANYEVAATDYVIYRALNEATTIPNAQAKANAHLQKFYQALGIKKQSETKAQAQGV